MLASLELETVQDTPVARLSGEVDATNARDLGSRLLDSVPNSALGLVLDLSRTSYLDSSGVQLLFELADRLRRRQQQLHLVVPDESFIGDVLEAVNLGGVARANATVLQALEALRAAHP